MVFIISCENNLCLYSEEGKCLLAGVRLNELGQCESQVAVNIPARALRRCKALQRAKLSQTAEELKFFPSRP